MQVHLKRFLLRYAAPMLAVLAGQSVAHAQAVETEPGTTNTVLTQVAEASQGQTSTQVAQASQSQTPATGGPAKRSLIEEVVVTAQKREQTLQKVPISVEVLSAQELAVSQVYSLEQLAAFNPSLNFRSDINGPNTSFALRGIGGFAAQGGIEPAIGVVVDGAPYARGGEFFAAELEDIERVEILKGPQGTLFGASNSGGVVNIVTRKPTDEFEFSGETGGTSENEYVGRIALSGPLADGIRARVTGFFKSRQGFIKNLFADSGFAVGRDASQLRDLRRLGEREEAGFRGMLMFDLKANATLLLTGSWNELNRSNTRQPVLVEDGPIGAARLAAQGLGDPVLGQQVLDSLFLVNQDGLNEENINRWRISGTFTWDINDTLRLNSITAYTDFTDSFDIDVDSSPAGPFNDFGLMSLVGIPRTNTNINRPVNSRTADTGVQYFTQEMRLEETGESIDWTLGGFYENLNELFNISTPFFARGAGGRPSGVLLSGPRFANMHRQLFSIFADGTWHTPFDIDVFAGIRGIQERGRVDFRRTVTIQPENSNLLTILPENGGTVLVDRSGLDNILDLAFSGGTSPTSWAGRAGLSWDYTSDVNFYFSASRGYTGFGVNTGNSTNPSILFVRPSTSRAFEVGTKSVLFGQLRINLAGFLTFVKDLQANVIPGAGMLNTFNAGGLRSKGIEGDLEWVVPQIPGLVLNASFTFLSTDLKDLIQPCFPGQTAAQGCLDLNGDGKFEQDLQNKPSVDAPSRAFNLRARYDLRDVAGLPFDAYIVPSYTWKSKVAFNLSFDPVASFQDPVGLLDLTVGFVSKDGRYELTLFGKNILNKQFFGNLQVQATITGLASATVPFDAQDRWGATLHVRF